MNIALRLAVPATLIFGVLALCAGRLDTPNHWAFPGIIWLGGALTYVLLQRRSPALVSERMRPPSDRDRATRRWVGLPFLSLLVVAGLDVRFGWSQVPLAVQITGLVLVAVGFAVVGWVLLSNPYASSAVRIQSERGHEVITTGPYAVVRHPMYLAVVLVSLGAGPALASAWAGLALLPVLALFIRRTLLEDRMLHRELGGYAAYASRVRWRVVPGLF